MCSLESCLARAILLSTHNIGFYEEIGKMSRVMRKPAFCICENKEADQLRGNREADQRLCFCYIDSTMPLLPKSEVSCLKQSSVTAQSGLCWTWSETLKTGFLTTRLKLSLIFKYPPYPFFWLYYEPRCEKNGLRGFRPGPTQTGLYSHRRWLEA